jgi:G:T-mismatch repair DNA endonuclease (very short patch repair protein)
MTTEMFIAKAKEIHGSKYSYERSIYTHNQDKLTITCPIHGDFSQRAIYHLQGNGCKYCGKEKVMETVINSKVYTVQETLEDLKKFPNLSFPYIESEYSRATSEITCICKFHGEFKDTFRRLKLSKHGCVKCSVAKRILTKKGNIDSIRKRLIEQCNGKYEFPHLENEYINNKSPITAICDSHGNFTTMGNSIATGSGCPKCKADLTKRNLSMSFEEFKHKSISKYGLKFNYISTNFDSFYKSSDRTVDLECRDCGLKFTQSVKDHLSGCVTGCPKCAKSYSGVEEKVVSLLDLMGIKYIQRSRKVIAPYEADIFIPDKNIIIEVNGVYWHSTKFLDKNYHREKREYAQKMGYRLIYIWEDEINKDPKKVESYLKNLLNLGVVSIGAREVEIKQIDHSTGSSFINTHHFMGNGAPASHYYGIFKNDLLLGVVSFRKNMNTKGDYELYRSCYLSGYRIQGGLSKVIKKAIKDLDTDLHCYIDLDKFNGESYFKCGFLPVGEITLKMSYVKKNERISRHHFRKSDLIGMRGYSPELSADDILAMNNIFSIYESGTLRTILRK